MLTNKRPKLVPPTSVKVIQSQCNEIEFSDIHGTSTGLIKLDSLFVLGTQACDMFGAKYLRLNSIPAAERMRIIALYTISTARQKPYT